MEPQRFDELAASVAEGETSRRSVLARLGGGGFAALLATLGIGGLDVEEAEAKKSCRKRCKKRKTAAKRRRCRRRCKKGTTRCTSNAQCTGFDVCFNGACVLLPVNPGDEDECEETGDCDDGLICVNDICVLDDECEDDDDCTDPLVCLLGICVADGDACDEPDDCVDPEICLLGICVDIGLDL